MSIPEHPKHKLGQNFLTDQNIVEKIITFVNPSPADHFLEIGAGTGILTRKLASSSARVHAVELDASLISTLSEIPKVNVIHSDILKVNPCEIDRSTSLRAFGNLPYYISTPILSHLIENRKCLKDMTLMFQDEVAVRILSPPSQSEYGLISVLTQYFCQIQKGFRISRHSFTPRPKVESRMLRFQFRSGTLIEFQEYHGFLVKAFSQRRKMLRNNLIRTLSFPAERIDSVFKKLHISATARAENLSPETYEQLILALK